MSNLDTLRPWGSIEPIPSLEGTYGATQNGHIVRIAGGKGSMKGKTLIAKCLNSGYLAVEVCVRNHSRTKTVHRLVAEAFYGEIPEGLFVCHTNHDKADNRITNLWIGTRQQNLLHSSVTCGNIGKAMTGKRPHNAKLTHRDCVEIQRLRESAGFALSHLGALYGMSVPRISQVVRGVNWPPLKSAPPLEA